MSDIIGQCGHVVDNYSIYAPARGGPWRPVAARGLKKNKYNNIYGHIL